MATTTNYGWTTPNDTDLVKDGAAAIRTFGSSVDTTTKNLNPSTTLGDIEYRSATANVNTRLPLGTAGQVLKVNSGATAPEWATDSSGMTNPMTTTGDTIYSSSGSTPARLAIGSTGNVLTVAGGVPTWAAPAGGGGMTSIASGSLSNAALSLTTISGSYKSLYLVLTNFTNASGFDINMRVNADSTGGRYAFVLKGVRNDAALDSQASSGQSSFGTSPASFKASANANFVFMFHNYASSAATKVIEFASIGNDNTNNVPMVSMGTAMYTTTTAITGISTTGTVVSGDYTLYGVN
jgi:hypothetical protein